MSLRGAAEPRGPMLTDTLLPPQPRAAAWRNYFHMLPKRTVSLFSQQRVSTSELTSDNVDVIACWGTTLHKPALHSHIISQKLFFPNDCNQISQKSCQTCFKVEGSVCFQHRCRLLVSLTRTLSCRTASSFWWVVPLTVHQGALECGEDADELIMEFPLLLRLSFYAWSRLNIFKTPWTEMLL